MNPVLRNIYKRRAVRKYKNILVAKKIIESIVDAGRMAPSAINLQPCNFIVIQNISTIVMLSKAITDDAEMFHLLEGIKFSESEDFVFHGAPVVILITTPRDNEWAPIDAGMCAQNMMLAASSLGVASCPVGFARFADKTNMVSLLKLPKGHIIQLGIVFGYSDDKPKVPKRRKDNVVTLK